MSEERAEKTWTDITLEGVLLPWPVAARMAAGT